jgi:hypothetical protein
MTTGVHIDFSRQSGLGYAASSNDICHTPNGLVFLAARGSRDRHWKLNFQAVRYNGFDLEDSRRYYFRYEVFLIWCGSLDILFLLFLVLRRHPDILLSSYATLPFLAHPFSLPLAFFISL